MPSYLWRQSGYNQYMSIAQLVRRYTLDEYLALELESETRHEYIDGEIFAMVGASYTHSVIVMNVGAALHQHLRGTPCRVIANDRKVLIAKAERVYYPDLLVTCRSDSDTVDPYTETAPRLIVEVLSPSTATLDRQQKRLDYQKLDSLQDYVLIAQDRREVQVFSRDGANQWLVVTFQTGDQVQFPSINATVSMATIYENIVG